jgi:hypothetical protein
VSGTDELRHYDALLRGLSRERMALVEAAWAGLAATFTPAGREGCLRGLRELEAAGVTWATLVTYLNEVPRVAREVGEAAVAPLLETAFKVYAHAGQNGVEVLLRAAPLAARRLREPRRLGLFLELVAETAERAPRGVPRFLEHTGTLLDHLGLEELRSWVRLGFQSHSADPFVQESWFDLRTPESRAFLKADGGGARFTDVRKGLAHYLRALWASGTELRGFATGPSSRPWASISRTPIAAHGAVPPWLFTALPVPTRRPTWPSPVRHRNAAGSNPSRSCWSGCWRTRASRHWPVAKCPDCGDCGWASTRPGPAVP